VAIKTRKHENLTETNIQHVKELLLAEKPITKKEACSILNISYNTTRLNKIIADHDETVAYRERRKSQNKGKGATEMEIKQVVNFYLDGSNVSDIAKSLYRSPAFIKAIINRIGIPQKLAMTDYEGRRSAMLPEQCVADDFQVGEKVWAVRQNYPAIVQRELKEEEAEERGYKIYLVYTIECNQDDLKSSYFPHLTFAGKYYPLPAYSIGKLEHLQKYL
jgi:transposase